MSETNVKLKGTWEVFGKK